MLTLRNTPNEAGIEISGDDLDLDSLYMALHDIVGDEGEFHNYENARLRVLGVCYDLRHARMGDRGVEFVPNGMDPDKMKLMGMVTGEKNLYYKCYVYYPEVLFVSIALNDFVRLYAKKRAKSAFSPLLDKKNIWDASIAHVRLFQAAIIGCVAQTVTEASFTRMRNLMHKDYTWTEGYITQYLDLLNIRYLEMNKEERKKALPTMIKRLCEQGTEYQDMEREIRGLAQEHQCPIEDISLIADYPEDVDW